ncbi:MAG: hypothetical protein ACXADA_06880 [Candidatus Hodarchaeales archaeon]|jgi:hypothetical protein
MSTIEEFTEAFHFVDRYEDYRLMRAWGMVIIAIGIGRFLLSWNISIFYFFLLDSLKFDQTTGSIVIGFLRSFIRFLLIIIFFVIVIRVFLSIKKTRIENGNIISKNVLLFGLTLAILYCLTFVIEIPGLVYFEEAVGVLIAYFLLRKCTKYSDFKEMLYLGFTLLGIAIGEFIWRLFFILFLFNFDIDSPSRPDPFTVPLFIISYLAIGFIFMIPYIISGLYSIKKATQIIERNTTKQ